MERTEHIEKKRIEFRQKFDSVFFNAYINLLLVCSVFAIGLICASINIDWRPRAILLVPLFFVYAEAAMYITHRWQQHRKIRFNERIFEMHAVWHHGMFSSEKMHVDSFKDMNMVLLPFFIHGLVIFIFYLPSGIMAEKIFQSDIGWILMFSVVLQLIWYEIVHALSHTEAPPNFIFKLANHHQSHHNPKLMGKCNFGIATTFFDWLLGTAYNGD